MAHCNTVMTQLLKFVDRHVFNKIESENFKPTRKYRKLSRWGQFVTMLFAQLGGQSSLRDIVEQLQAQSSGLYHLGLHKVCRSTLADANNKRPAEFFQEFFNHTYSQCAAVAPRKNAKFKFKNKLFSLDASTIDLCLSVFPWAKFRSTKGGIKLHAVVDHDGYIPAFADITTAKTSDLSFARLLKLPSGSIVVADRGYVGFDWFHSIAKNKSFFVTRMKKRIKYRVVERQKVLKNKGLTSDHTIVLTGTKSKDCPIKLRRIGYRDPKTGKHYVFLTNIFHLCAKTIADIYKERWQIELFFKWIKQNLKIKSFLGTSKNAVMTQIWIALIACLVLAYLKFMAQIGKTITQIFKLLQLNLFKRRNLLELFIPPPNEHKTSTQQIFLPNFS